MPLEDAEQEAEAALRKDEFAEPVVDVLRTGVVEAHVEFDEEAHHEVEVEVGNKGVGMDVANAASVVRDVEDELWEIH